MKPPAWMPFEPSFDLRMFVGGVIVDDGFDHFADGHRALNLVEKANELLVPVLLHAAADHAAVEHVERREQRRCAVALVVMRHGAAASRLQRQPRLGAVERLDLAFLID